MNPRSPSHFTTRRAFVATTGFGLVSLYLLWAGYGAAPLGGGGHDESAAGPAGAGGHGDHGALPSGPSADEFRRLTQAFVEQHKLADGSVRPRRPALVRAGEAEHHAGHGAEAMRGVVTAEGSRSEATEPREAIDRSGAAPVEVYLMAYQWGYTPSVLHLEAGVPYRFRMMAVDVAHGAAIQLGRGGRIIRLRTGALVEQELTFTRPGEYLLYCTVYCGLPHDRMQGRIVVAPPESRS